MMSLISAIIMASGFSRRMGENKLLMKYNNKFLIEYTLDVISKCNFKDKLIVGRVRYYSSDYNCTCMIK